MGSVSERRTGDFEFQPNLLHSLTCKIPFGKVSIKSYIASGDNWSRRMTTLNPPTMD